jgi:hypothetical protein
MWSPNDKHNHTLHDSNFNILIIQHAVFAILDIFESLLYYLSIFYFNNLTFLYLYNNLAYPNW